MRDDDPEENAHARKVESVALFATPVILLSLAVVANVLADNWFVMGGTIVCGLIGAPLYLVWLVWFLVRGSGRR